MTDEKTRLWALILHLSMLSGYVVPFAGFVAPVVIWLIMKDELPALDVHGKNAVNFLISSLIYAAVSAILVLVFVGIFLLIAVGLISIIFPIIAGIKAYQGEAWKYPLTITFIK